MSMGKRLKAEPYLIPYSKNQFKVGLDLNIRTWNNKIPRRTLTLGVSCLTLILAMTFLDLKLKAKGAKGKINRWGCIKLRIF